MTDIDTVNDECVDNTNGRESDKKASTVIENHADGQYTSTNTCENGEEASTTEDKTVDVKIDGEKKNCESNKGKDSQKKCSQPLCELCQIEILANTKRGGCDRCKSNQLCNLCMQRHRFNKKCLPWRPGRRKNIGRCLLSTREIKPLEVVLVDSPVLIVPSIKLTCFGCARQVNCRYKCEFCSLPLCGPDCPLKSRHKVECEVIRGISVPDLQEESQHLSIYSVVAVLRLLRLEESSPESWYQIRSLETHCTEIQRDQTLGERLRFVNSYLNDLGFSSDRILQAFGIIRINSYPVSELEGSYSRGIYPVQSLINHSCTPNLQYIEKDGGSRLVLQSVRTIEPGEPLTVRYVPFIQGRIAMARKLREHWYFQCNCPRCKDGTELGTFTSSALCENKDCNDKGAILLMVDPSTVESDWICPSCQTIRTSKYVENLEKSYIDKFKDLPKCDMNTFYSFLNELGDRFHSTHHLVMRMAKFLVVVQGKKLESLPREQIETQSVLCDKLLSYVSRLDPGATQTRAKFLLEKNKADLNLAKRDCEAGKISRKVFMSKIKEGVRAEVNAKKILFFKWEDEDDIHKKT